MVNNEETHSSLGVHSFFYWCFITGALLIESLAKWLNSISSLPLLPSGWAALKPQPPCIWLVFLVTRPCPESYPQYKLRCDPRGSGITKTPVTWKILNFRSLCQEPKTKINPLHRKHPTFCLECQGLMDTWQTPG